MPPSSQPSLKSLVRKGYNLASMAHRDDKGRGPFKNTFSYQEWARDLGRRLKPGCKVLDLGCGNGLPMSRLLSGRFEVLGVDLSEVQIRRASRLVPQATFRRADMVSLKLPKASLDGICCIYALIHVPRSQQQAVIAKAASWLKPGGVFLLIVGMHAGEGSEHDWLGVKGATMFWAQEDLKTYEQWFNGAGFKILRRRRIPEGKVAHQLYLLKLKKSI
jgi:cyclopropane fatty-acyl-phospholipid synthase-like methyltransferase